MIVCEEQKINIIVKCVLQIATILYLLYDTLIKTYQLNVSS